MKLTCSIILFMPRDRFAKIVTTAAMVLTTESPLRAQTPATPPVTAPSTQPAKNLPPAKEIIDGSLKAMGGKEAFEKLTSTRVVGKMNMMGTDATMEFITAKPNKYLVKQTAPGIGEMQTGSNGELTWLSMPRGGYQLLDADQAKEMRRQADVYRIVWHMQDDQKEFQTVDRLTFRNADCYKVRLVDEHGKEQFAFFNAESKLAQGLEMTEEGPMGPVTATLTFDEWKQIGDVKVFTRITIEQMGVQQKLDLTDVEFNKVDDAVFEPPDAVKELAKKQPSPPPPPPPATQPATQPQSPPGKP
jgi:outer membrane lipoprotein-sorting protein